MHHTRQQSRIRSIVAAACVIAGSLVAPALTAPVAVAAPAPVQQRPASLVTSDVLPTMQVDGVVWAQAIVGNTVYVAGSFTTAIPAPSDPDQTTSPRANLLAYDLTTGKLIPSFNIALNAQAVTLATSPDKKRLYVGGDFNRRIMAIDTATNKVITSFWPTMNSRVSAIVATNTTVYVGGSLTSANGVARTKLAAFNAADGALLGWAPVASRSVKAMTITPDGSKIIVGGQFESINGVNVFGLAALSPVDGSVLPWAATGQVRAYGPAAAISSLRTDGSRIYGTAYTFANLEDSGIHEFEGLFSADPNSGQLHWLEDCHGDTHDSFATPTAVYLVGHPYSCPTVGGFPEQPQGQNRRALAFSYQATGTLDANTKPLYKDWAGTPSPTLFNWFPDLASGTYTGQKQGPWSVTGSGPYIVMGGEFPTVNGLPQKGLVRMATRPTAPGKDGPRAAVTIDGTSVAPGSVRLKFQTSWDRDDVPLTYKVVRNNNTASPIYTGTTDSTFWNRPFVDVTDSGLTPGATYTYQVLVADSSGNTVEGPPVTVTVAVGSSQYRNKVVADSPTFYYRLSEQTGTTVFDAVGTNDATATAGVTRGVPGALPSDTNTASRFDGLTARAAGAPTTVGMNDSFTLEGWARTTSTSGGPVMLFGTDGVDGPVWTDRALYFDNAGHVLFGVDNGEPNTVGSPATYNDGRWHHLAASLGADGMKLYVDGGLVAGRTDVTTAAPITGFWRLGGESLTGWTDQPASNFLNGDLDEIAYYPRVLPAGKIAEHFVAGKTAAADTFGRSLAGGWGTAEVGGPWTLGGGTSNFSVSGGTAKAQLSAAGAGPTASLAGISVAELNGSLDFAIDKPATGGGVSTNVSVRKVGTTYYQFTLKYLANGTVTVAIAKVVSGAATSLGTATVPGLTYAPGNTVRLKFAATGTGTTTLSVKAWKVGTAEPSGYQLTGTDATPSLQGAGSLTLQAFLSTSATNAPVVASYDNLNITVP